MTPKREVERPESTYLATNNLKVPYFLPTVYTRGRKKKKFTKTKKLHLGNFTQRAGYSRVSNRRTALNKQIGGKVCMEGSEGLPDFSEID